MNLAKNCLFAENVKFHCRRHLKCGQWLSNQIYQKWTGVLSNHRGFTSGSIGTGYLFPSSKPAIRNTLRTNPEKNCISIKSSRNIPARIEADPLNRGTSVLQRPKRSGDLGPMGSRLASALNNKTGTKRFAWSLSYCSMRKMGLEPTRLQ